MSADIITRIKDILSLTGKQVFVLAFASWALLLLPESFITRMGLSVLRAELRPLVGFVALGSTAYLMALPIYAGGARVVAEFQNWRRRRFERRKLESLSPVERDYLKQYIDNDTTTRTFRYSDGVAQGLESRGIIVRMSTLSRGRDYFDYNLHPWANEILRLNPDLLEGARPRREDV